MNLEQWLNLDEQLGQVRDKLGVLRRALDSAPVTVTDPLTAAMRELDEVRGAMGSEIGNAARKDRANRPRAAA